MNNKIIVSVYCLTYNHRNYIKDALNGFVTQDTSFHYEVFVHDDASTDGTTEIIQEYALKYPDIIFPIYQQENQYSKGIPIFKEFILPKMHGKYIAVCEGDDYWTDSSKLQKQVTFLENHPEYAACVHNTLELNLQSKKTRFINTSKSDYDITFPEIIQGGNQVYQISSLMYKKELAIKAYGSQSPDFFKAARGFGDYNLAIFLVTEGKMRFICDTMSAYRFLSPNSWTSRNASADKWENHINNVNYMLTLLDQYMYFQWTKEIQAVIRKNNFSVLIAKKDYSTLIKSYADLWKKQPFPTKMDIYLINRHPYIHTFIKHILDFLRKLKH